MNYIPGFSNYLETSVPRYAKGGPARFVEEDIYDGVGQFEQPMTNAGGLSSNFGASEDLKRKLAAEAMAAMGTPSQAAVAPTAQAVAPAAAPETVAEERARLTSYIPAALLGGANPNDFDMGFLREMAKAADLYNYDVKSAAYQKANPKSTYALADPAEYFKAFGTVPISFTGTSGYYDKGVSKTPTIDYLTPEAGATYSLYSPKTGQLIGTGTGAEGLVALTKQANEMNESQGRKADFQLVKTGAGSTTPEVIGTNLYNSDRTALGKVMGVVGQALPLAAMAIPGLNVLGGIAVGAGLGGVGAQLQGKNALKGALMGGLSAAGGQVLGPALEGGGALGTNLAPRLATSIGTGIGSTAGGLVTGQSLKNSLLGGVASGALSYVSPEITKGLKGLGIGPGSTPTTSTSGGGGGYDGILVNASPAVTPISLNTSLGGSPNKIQQALNQKTEIPYDGLSVTGSRLGSTFGVDLGGNRFGTPGKGEVSLKELNPEDIVVDATTRTTPVSAPVTNVGGGEITPEYLPKEDIVVDATTRTTPVSVPVTGPLTTTAPAVLPNDIVVDATKKVEPTSVSVLPPIGSVVDTLPPMDLKPDPKLTQAEKDKLGLEEYLRLASLAAGLLGNLGGGKGGSGGSGTYTPGGGRLNPIFSAQLPAAGGLGTIGATRTARPLGDVDWLTYGQRPELKFFDYAVRNNPAPVTTPVPGNPAGPIMEERNPMAMAKGGRSTFAVNGPGTGRSDDIPAVLSDGEYVIDAETVALLGDGSSKAGAKKLDDLRVKVRKHKGKKLAKGRFSANAKKPEAYLSGGRI